MMLQPNQRHQIPSELIESRAEVMKPTYLTILRLSLTNTYPEIAAEIGGVPIGTVRSRLSRAREWLRKSFKHDNGAPKFAKDWTLLDDQGNRSIFDDVDQ